MSAEPFLVYDPPYGGQVLRVRGAAEAWARVSAFLTQCTDADPDRPESVALTIYEPATGEPREWLEPTLREAEAAFRAGERRAWTAGVREDYCVEWRLQSQDAERARAFLTAGEPWPKTEFGPASLSLGYTFRWVDLETGVVLPGQTADRRAHAVQATSDIGVTLSRRSSVILTGRFPFSAADTQFIAYLERIGPRAPAPLLAGRFRQWLPTRKPTELGYTVRRVSAGLLDGIAR